MDKSRYAKQVAVVAGICFLCGFAPGASRAQNSPAGQARQTPQAAAAPRPMKDPRQTDIYEGLQFSDEQKAKIDAIHRDIKFRRDAVLRDDKLSGEQKDAMLEGYRRMENGQIFEVLTPEQKEEVRKRVHALHAAQQPEKQKKPSPAPH